MNNNEVVNVSPLDNYTLFLEFNNGEEKVFDVKPYLEMEVFKPLKDMNLFNAVKIYRSTIQWDNEIDIDPETLYEDSVPLLKEQIQSF